MILHLPIVFPRCVKGLRLGILILGMISCGAVSCITDDMGSSSSLDAIAWLLLSPAPEDARDRGNDREDRVSGLLGKDGSCDDCDSKGRNEASSRESEGVKLCDEPRREV
jgi:hypothetical protein